MKQGHVVNIRSFNRFYTNVIGLLDRHILDSSYSLPEVRVMFELNKNPGLTATEIIDFLAIDKGYLSRILHQFEKQRLITKTPNRGDKRASSLSLTAKGKEIFRTLDHASEQQVRNTFSHLTETEFDSLIGSMKTIQSLIAKRQKNDESKTAGS